MALVCRDTKAVTRGGSCDAESGAKPSRCRALKAFLISTIESVSSMVIERQAYFTLSKSFRNALEWVTIS
jgi:hypothetical protein